MSNIEPPAVLHVVSSLECRYGGPPQVVLQLARAQAAEGLHVRILTHAPERSRELPDVGDSLDVAFLSTPPRKFKRPNQLDRRLVDRCVGSADVVHLHNIWDPLLLTASAAAIRHTKPYIVLPHGMLDPWSLAQRSIRKQLALFAGRRRMLNQATAIHALTSQEARDVRAVGVRTPAYVIANGVSVQLGIRPRTDRQGSRYLLFLGRLHYKKGLDILAQALHRFHQAYPAWQTIIAGPDDGFEAALRKDLCELQLGDRVQVLGPMFGREKMELLRHASMFVLPSRQEGFSIAVLEAMSHGVPVVLSPACHFERVECVGAGVVVPLDPEQIASALIRLASDDAARTMMGENAAALVRREFTWDCIARQTIDLYRQVCGQNTDSVLQPATESS